MKKSITLNVNGATYDIVVEPYRTLVDVLRDDLGLTGTKRGCGRGNCGTCTILVDGKAVNSCLVLALDMVGRSIVTIEGLAQDGSMHPIQEAFVRYGAVQCGYCTPGLIMATKAFLEKNPKPSEEEVRSAISGNICRCTGYAKVIDAILAVAEGRKQ
ncbi:MAG: (2Fe-2S)-binding protein [Dehalococcoidia bacterium]|nr:(2Fe-2S)-binding protein [Dehalococcoidia bacterium]